jgi:hypothetical protein
MGKPKNVTVRPDGTRVFSGFEILEISIVSIPANADATIAAFLKRPTWYERNWLWCYFAACEAFVLAWLAALLVWG